ncbi:hypothetical protein AMATHDRAFT_166420 [Amanita thiersii Skay4041]|uniref:CCHC-type domain-containing protein n=1 Tax=Amanita thiersii Skay4041 TaxID=703135 RepID=A0A2A9N9H2_9AGAR|nr:hypothetical protein AMATHDRAFT_166420 [Amanita thiersii Skay4041]
MLVLELPTTLEKWYKLVIRLDQQWRQAVAERKVFAARGGNSTGGQTGATHHTGQQGQNQAVQRDLNAMQVDRNRSPIHCYNCGQTGHMA